MTDTPINRCPKCRSAVILAYETWETGLEPCVKCDDCGHRQWATTLEQAIILWNKERK